MMGCGNHFYLQMKFFYSPLSRYYACFSEPLFPMRHHFYIRFAPCYDGFWISQDSQKELYFFICPALWWIYVSSLIFHRTGPARYLVTLLADPGGHVLWVLMRLPNSRWWKRCRSALCSEPDPTWYLDLRTSLIFLLKIRKTDCESEFIVICVGRTFGQMSRKPLVWKKMFGNLS